MFDQNLFFGAGACRSQAFIGGARTGAKIFHLDPEPKKKNIWSRSRGKIVRLRNTDSEAQLIKNFVCFYYFLLVLKNNFFQEIFFL